MATQLIRVNVGEAIKPGDEIYDGRFWRMVKAYDFQPATVQPGQEVRRKFNPHPTVYRDAFDMNE